MIGKNKGGEKEQRKDKIRKRIRAAVDRDNYKYYPGEKQTDFYDNDATAFSPCEYSFLVSGCFIYAAGYVPNPAAATCRQYAQPSREMDG